MKGKMVEAVGTMQSSVGASAIRVASAQSSATASTQTATATVATSATTALGPLSPIASVDPLSGVVVTQYLSDAGDVTAQVPSTTAVAYMRLGLTAEGMPAQTESVTA